MNNRRRVFVAQLVDKDNNNPQSLNARAILSRATSPDIEWIVPHYGEPDPALVGKANIRLVKLWRGRLWQWHKALLYQLPADAIFYPNAYWFDDLPLRFRQLTGRRVPVIATMEGLAGDSVREQQLSEWAGHPVYTQHIPPELLARIDRVQREADHNIAISPFIASMGRRLYGDKFSVIPLGIDTTVFHNRDRQQRERFTVVGAGRMYDNKRPGLFLDLATRYTGADFIWYGEGEQRQNLLQEARQRDINNLYYPGPVSNKELAYRFREAHLFVLPSLAEGVPKVTQEATACGLPVIVFGFYEAPSVVDGENGYVVWNDEELFARVGELIDHPDRACGMGARGAEMVLEWDWNLVAPLWEERIKGVLTSQ